MNWAQMRGPHYFFLAFGGAIRTDVCVRVPACDCEDENHIAHVGYEDTREVLTY